MVLYKRKKVSFVRPPDVPENLQTQVYVIPDTKEWFVTYEEYLARMDYYKTPKFVCEITGNSCLTYFEALKSEEKEIVDVEKNCPEALREHILRFLQFNRITRLDLLVDKVYSVFKNDYFPGETIFIKNLSDFVFNTSVIAGAASPSDGTSTAPAVSAANPANQEEPKIPVTKQRGTIREKVQYGSSGIVNTKYLVVTVNDQKQLIMTPERIARDRNHFNKWLIKTFIKLTMSRSTKVGAPWVVKEKFAKKYRIPQDYPEDLKHFADTTPNGEIKFISTKKRSYHLNKNFSQNISNDEDNSSPKPELDKKVKKVEKPAKKKRGPREDSEDKRSKKAKSESVVPGSESASLSGAASAAPSIAKILEPIRKEFPAHHIPEPVKEGFEKSPHTLSEATLQPTKTSIVEDLEIKFDIQNGKPIPSILYLPENSRTWNKHLVSELTSELNDAKSDDEVTETDKAELASDIRRLSSEKLFSVQDSLQSWVFINIYHSVLKIDTFTYDDFIFSMGWNLDQYNELGRCELLDEIWCSVLGAIVSNEIPTKQQASQFKNNDEIFGLLVNLPAEDEDLDNGSDTETEKTLKSEDDSDTDDESENEKHPSKEKVNTNGSANTDTVPAGQDADDEAEVVEDESENESAEEQSDDENGNEDTENEGNDDDDDVDHNAYVVMNHRNITWHDRLRKRNFKDGNWQCVLLGVLSLIEYVPAYKPYIKKLFQVLAPKNLSATPATVLNQFYEELDIDLKFRILGILVELLSSGNLVRNYIDECLESSANMRRSRLDNLKDFKLNLEVAQKNNVLLHELAARGNGTAATPADAGDVSTPGSVAPSAPTVVRRPRLNFKVVDMTEEDEKNAAKYPEYTEAWAERKNAILKLESLKNDKKEIERKLIELDCQRVKLLGKDRLLNRYWWFENNGLPTFFGGNNNDDENEDEDKEKDKESEEDEDDDKNDVLDETYLMGRLWIQGPSDWDLQVHFKSSFDESEDFNRTLEHLEQQESQEIKQETSDPPSSEDNSVKVEIKPESPGVGEEIHEMDFKNLPKPFTNAVSKLYNLNFESNEIRSSQGEVIIDKHGSLASIKLLSQLSPLQRKIIEEQPGPTINGTCWRYYDKPSDIDKLLAWLNPWGKRESLLRKELTAVKEVVIQSMEARRKALYLDKLPDDEIEIEEQIEKIGEKVKNLKPGEVEEDSESEMAVDSDDDVISGGKRRSLRRKTTPTKRQKYGSFTEVFESGDIHDLTLFTKNLEEKLAEKKKHRELQRVVEWVNSTALEELEKSLYDGGDKLKPKKKAKK